MRAALLGLSMACVLGCSKVGDTPKTEQKPAADDQDQGFGVANVGRPNLGQGRSSIIGRKTREVLNVKEELKKPNVRVIHPDVHGNDPLTQYRTAYLKAASFVGSLPLKQWIRQQKVLNDRYPSYDELQEFMKKYPALQLPVLTGGRKYGYDEDSGEVVVLEYAQEDGDSQHED